jgi:hypothetical protein
MGTVYERILDPYAGMTKSYYTLITPLLYPNYTLIIPLLHSYYTLITPLLHS